MASSSNIVSDADMIRLTSVACDIGAKLTDTKNCLSCSLRDMTAQSEALTSLQAAYAVIQTKIADRLSALRDESATPFAIVTDPQMAAMSTDGTTVLEQIKSVQAQIAELTDTISTLETRVAALTADFSSAQADIANRLGALTSV